MDFMENNGLQPDSWGVAQKFSLQTTTFRTESPASNPKEKKKKKNKDQDEANNHGFTNSDFCHER